MPHTKNNLYPVILAGGHGTRLWPISRKNNPKQLQKFFGHHSLLQTTYYRLAKKFKLENIIVAINKEHKKLVAQQLPQLKNNNIIAESCAKGTALAVGFAAAKIKKTNPQGIFININSDAYIKNENEYLKALEVGGKIIGKHPDKTLLLGVNPSYPETQYGYIKVGQKIDQFKKYQIFKIIKFNEKPNLITAKKYLTQWDRLWNPSIIITRADNLLNLYKKHSRELYSLILKYPKCNSKLTTPKNKIKYHESIDKIILEKSKNMWVMPTNFGWSDVGNWSSLKDALSKSKKDNIIQGNQVITIDGQNNLIFNLSDQLLSTAGISDTIIINMPDATLICAKNKAQDVKKIIHNIRNKKLNKFL